MDAFLCLQAIAATLNKVMRAAVVRSSLSRNNQRSTSEARIVYADADCMMSVTGPHQRLNCFVGAIGGRVSKVIGVDLTAKLGESAKVLNARAALPDR